MLNFGPIEVIVILAILVGSAVWIAALVDCAMNERGSGTDRIFWVLIVLLGSFVGALLYLTIRRKRREEDLARDPD